MSRKDHPLGAGLGEWQRRFRGIFDQAPIGVFLYDADLRMVAQNPRFCAMLATTPERLSGLDLTRLHDQRPVGAMRRALTGEVAYYEGPYVATTGPGRIMVSMSLSPLRDDEGTVIGAMGLVEDITERVTSREALERSEARFRALIERSPDLVAVYDRGGKLLFVNRAMVEVLGYGAATELVGRSVLDTVHPHDHARTRVALGDPPQSMDLRMVRKDQSVGFLEVVTMPIDFDGEQAFLSVARDMTERRLMQAELLLSDRMASVGTLAAGMAHEINNPLAYLRANLEGIGSRKLPELRARVEALAEAASGADAEKIARLFDEMSEMLRLAREGSDQVRSIVADLKAFSRAEDAPTSWVDVQRVLDAAIHVAWSEVRARASLVKEYRPVPAIYGNESRLAQVFLNVIVNAAHAIGSRKGGEIVVTTDTSPAGEAVVSVRDNGEGMTPEVASRVFDPFFTTKPAGLGTGLGLWICQGIVSALSGRIDVTSEPDRGTTFTITLPPSFERKASEPRLVAARPRTRQPRILVIDDEPQIGSVVQRTLLPRYDVTVASRAKEGLERIRDEDFDAVLCDLGMPELGGVDLYEAAIRERPSLASRFVFMTGGATDARSRAFLEKGHAKLQKPFEVRDLVLAIDLAVGRG